MTGYTTKLAEYSTYASLEAIFYISTRLLAEFAYLT